MSALRHRNFRLVWSGQIVSVVGDGMRTVALLWLAKSSTSSGFGTNAAVVAVAAATTIPVIVGSPLGGWLADRLDRRRLLVVADLHRGAVSAVLAALLFTDRLTLPWLCTLVAIAACGTALLEPTFAATIPTLVPAEERAGANGLNLANSAGGGLLGPLIGGALVAAFGAGWVLAIDAVSFGLSACLIAWARISGPVRTVLDRDHAVLDRDHAVSDPDHADQASLRTTFAHRSVRRLAGLACILNFFAAPLGVMLLALAVDRFGMGPRLYGVLAMMVPAGMLAGSLLAPKVAAHRSALICSLLGVGLTLAVAGLVSMGVALAVLVGCGVTLAIANTVLITTLQNIVAPEVQGRAFGVLGSLSLGLRPAGLLLAAPLLAATGVGTAFALVGAGIVVVTVLWGRPGQLVP